MPSVNVKSDILGINLQLESDFELDERGVFDVLRGHDPRMPARLLKKFNRYRENEKVQNLTLKALDNGFFEGDGTFMDALGETASLAGEGLVNIPLSSQLEWQFKTFAPKYANVDSSRYDESRWNPSVTEAAKYLAGLTESQQSLGNLLFPSGTIERVDANMGKALKYAGLPDDLPMRKKVTDRLLGLDKSRTLATRGQAAVETWAMSATIGRKGQQYAKEFKDLVTGNATERGDKLIYLDYLYEQNRINEVVGEGAEIAAQLGGAKGVGLAAFTVDPEKGSVFGQPPADEQTLKDLQSGAVEPDLAQSLVMSIPMSPDFTLTLGAAGATHAIRNSVNRGAIIGLSAKASEESAFAATVKQLSELPKRTATQNALLNQAKKRLADVAGSQEKLAKLVAKNRAVAEAVGISAVEKGKRFSPTTARLMEALDRAPGPKAPFLNRTVGQALKAAGVSTEYLGRTVEFLHRLPEEALTTIAMRAGMEESAAQQLARGVARGTLAVGAAGAATGGFEFDPDLTQLAIALVLTPGGHQLLTRLGRDGAIYGKELTRAQAGSPLFQRLAQMEPVDASFTNVLLDRTSALTLGETVSNLRGAVFSPTREFGISPALKVPSAVLTHTGLGNTLTGLANTARTAAYASTFPAALGYAIGGEEGAGSALGASIFPLVVGMGLGHMARVKGKAELQQKMLGDETIYKEDYLSSGERNTFEKFSRTARQALATSALQNPDVVYNFKKGRGSSSHEIVNGESVITIYEKATTAEILSAVLGHEIAHHIDSYGFHPQIIEELLGSVEKGIPGAFTEFKDGKPVIVTDKDGNQVYKTNMEFAATHEDVKAGRANKIGHRQQYLDKLEKAGYEKGSPEYQSYANDDYNIAREIFASHGAAWYFGAEFVKNNYQGAGAKLMGKILDPIFNSNGLRKFFHRIGLATEESSGVVADPTGLMPGLKEIPALTKMIKKYNDEVRGLDKAGRKSWAARRGSLVDSAFGDELATASFTAKDLENPAIAASLRAGGHVSIREDGSIEVDASGKPVFLPTREVNKRNKRLANDILEIIKKKEDAGESFGAGHVTLETTADGRLRAVGRFLDPSIINELVKLNRYNPHQLDALKAINKTLKEGEGKSWNLFYYSALKWNRAGRKVYGQIKGGDRISLPFGIELTKDGNVIIQTISLEAFKKNLNWFAKSKGWRQKMQEAFGSRDADGNLMQTSEYVLVKRAMDLLPKYLDNHMRGIENGTEGSGISVAQRDFINAAIGRVNAEQVAKNPILEGLGDRRSQRQQSIRSRRLDRIGNARMGDRVGAVNLTKVGQNLAALMPGGRPKKPGREKRVTARFSDDLAGRIKALAAQKGISQNDALIELIEQGLDVPEATPEQAQPIPPKETTPPIEPVDPSPDRLTPAEEEILRGSPRTPEESALYRAAHKKRTDIELRKIKDSHKYFMPSIEQRKASKYGEVFKQAGLDDIELAKAARTKWKEMGNSSPFVQRFLSGETDDAPAFAQMKNGEWKPIELYHVGTLGVASGKSRNPLEIFNDSPTVKNSESWAPESTTVLVLDRKKAYDLQRAQDADQKPLQVITNAKYIFDVKNPEHVKTLDEQLAATARDEGVDPSLQEFSPTDPSSLFAYETELKKRGWHGYRFEEGGVEQIAIFDSKRIKLNQDQRGEGKFYSKDRDFGKVSGLFGHRLATDRFSANPQAAKDIRFMPQMEFDFTPPKSQKPKGENRPNWWQVYKINPKDPNVYDLVADEIIWRGSPEHDGSIAEQYSTFLNLDVRKLRPAMARAHRRWERGDRRFMPAQDEQVQELKDQLEMLGPDPMYRDYPELARAMENVENFLTPDERIEYLGLKVADRRARQEFERTFGVDPVIKPASARTVARQAGQYQVYDNWKRFIHDPMNKMEDASAARRRFRTGDVDKMFMPADDRPLGLSDNIRDEVLPGIKQDKFSRGQLEAALGKTAGAKAYAKEIGLMDWLKDRKSVTKVEVDQFVRENAPRLEEKRLSGPPEGEEVSLREQDRTRAENGDEVIQIDAEGDYFTITVEEDAGNVYVQGERGEFLELDTPMNRQTEQDGWRAIENHYREKQGEPTKFSDYQEPGGTNYREVLIKLPKNSANNSEIQALRQEAQSILEKRQALEAEGKYWDSNALSPEIGAINARIRKLQSQDNFKDPHYHEDNILLHLRLNDRIDANGKKVLFIEELQSDWHQKGRKDGYAGFNKKDYRIERNKAGNWDVIRLKDGEVVDVVAGKATAGANKGEAIPLERAWEIFENAVDAGILGGVPDAPFKKNWPALGLKRVIREALENGYDRIAWLDGEGQAARYDLSRQVNAIEVIRDGDGTYEIMARPADEMGGEFRTLATKIPKEKLADYIGKEPAKKALEKMEDGLAHLEGLDLKVGGEGMKAFYDRELVSVANKISKKIGGGKVRRETIPRGKGFLSSEAKRTLPISHVLDLPKNPQAVENLRLFMPAEKAPSDSRSPAILRDKMFMPAIPNFRDSWVLPNGTVLPLKGRPYRINSKNKSEIVDENYVAGDEHHLAILEWIQANPKNPLSQKVIKRLKADSQFKYGEDEVVDAWNAMEHAIDLGAVRLKKSIPELRRTVLEANPKAMTAEQRRALELTAIEHGLHVLFDRRDRSGTKAGKTFFDGRAPDSKMFMPASELKKEFGVKQAEEIQYKRLFMPTSKDGEDYRGYHEAPDRDNGAPLHDLTDMYPSDIYGPNGARYYGTGDSAMDAKSIAIIQEMYGNPDGEVTIYRAVPEFADEIRPNDWVTIVREYAELHGESGNAGGDNYKILSKKVKASELFTEANSLHEWGWSPEDKSSKQFMPASEAGASKGKLAEAAKLWQEKGTDSPYFKKWFGKSKVVDENGDPLVVYHGTKADFTEFERSRGGEFGSGIYFSENIDSAKMFGSFQKGDSEVVTMPVYLTLKNPLITNDRNVPRGAGIKSLIKKGYDGVIGTTPNGQKQYVAFSPEQIKSATGNRGTFDAGERNINYMPSDPKAPKRQPVNRLQPQARPMPGNRFMVPAVTTGGKLSERFR